MYSDAIQSILFHRAPKILSAGVRWTSAPLNMMLRGWRPEWGRPSRTLGWFHRDCFRTMLQWLLQLFLLISPRVLSWINWTGVGLPGVAPWWGFSTWQPGQSYHRWANHLGWCHPKNIVVFSTEPIHNLYFLMAMKKSRYFQYSRYHVITHVSRDLIDSKSGWTSDTMNEWMNVIDKLFNIFYYPMHMGSQLMTLDWHHNLHSTEVGMCAFSLTFGIDGRCFVSLYLVFF